MVFLYFFIGMELILSVISYLVEKYRDEYDGVKEFIILFLRRLLQLTLVFTGIIGGIYAIYLGFFHLVIKE